MPTGQHFLERVPRDPASCPGAEKGRNAFGKFCAKPNCKTCPPLKGKAGCWAVAFAGTRERGPGRSVLADGPCGVRGGEKRGRGRGETARCVCGGGRLPRLIRPAAAHPERLLGANTGFAGTVLWLRAIGSADPGRVRSVGWRRERSTSWGGWLQAGVPVIQSGRPASALPAILSPAGPRGFGELEFSQPRRSLRVGSGKNRDPGGKSVAAGAPACGPFPSPETQPRGQVCWPSLLGALGPPRKGRGRRAAWGGAGAVLGEPGPLPRSPPPHARGRSGSWEGLRWEGRWVTFPGRATGPEDSLPFGTEGLGDPGPKWGRQEPFGCLVNAGARRVSCEGTGNGRQTGQGPFES